MGVDTRQLLVFSYTWAVMLGDTIERMGGAQVTNEFVAGHHDELPAMLTAAISADSST